MLIKTVNEKWITISSEDIKWSLVPSEYPSCQTIDLLDYEILRNKTPIIIILSFHKSANLGIFIRIDDKKMALRKRGLRSQINDYDGIPIEIEDFSHPMTKKYYMTFSQIIHLETEKGINCRKYPNKEFFSYKECDEHFVYTIMKDKYKIMPFWAAKTLDTVTDLM